MKILISAPLIALLVSFALPAQSSTLPPEDLCGEEFTHTPIVHEITKKHYALCFTLPTAHVTLDQATKMAAGQNLQHARAICKSGFKANPISKAFPRVMGVSVITRVQCK